MLEVDSIQAVMGGWCVRQEVRPSYREQPIPADADGTVQQRIRRGEHPFLPQFFEEAEAEAAAAGEDSYESGGGNAGRERSRKGTD